MSPPYKKIREILSGKETGNVFINDVMDQGLCSKKGMNQKSWAHLISVVVCGLRESLVD